MSTPIATKEDLDTYDGVILVVDDEAEVLRALQRELAYWLAEHKVRLLTAQSGEEALEILSWACDSVALVISDLQMPGLKGGDLLLQVHQKYPIILLGVLTAYGDISQIRKAVSATIHALILKPWETDALIGEIEKAMDSYRLRRDNRSHLQQIQEQLRAAGQFQKDLLQTRIPESEGLHIDVTYQPDPGLQVGGDYYEIVGLEEGRLMLLLGDVTGRGIRPALITAMLKLMSAEIFRGGGSSPSRLLTLMNNRVCRELRSAPDVLIPFSAALVDRKNGMLRLSNAGHLPVAHLKGGRCEMIHVDGTALGFAENLEYAEQQVTIAPGDIVVFFTDGLLDGGHGGIRLEEQTLQAILLNAKDRGSVGTFNGEVLRQVKAAGGGRNDSDDLTLVSIHIL